MSEKSAISYDEKKLEAFCKKHHVKKLSFFGSILSGEFNEKSDVDVLIEFEPGHVPGFFFFALQSELSEILGRCVDLHTSAFLSRYFREDVISQAEVKYAA